MDYSILKTQSVYNIGELRIGDVICRNNDKFPMFVVALFADAGTLGYQPADYTGTIYCDFADNPGDVVEIDLAQGPISRVINYGEYIEAMENQ